MIRRTARNGKPSRRPHKLTLEVNALEDRALLSTAPMTTASVMGQTGFNGYYTSPVVVNLTATEANTPSSSLTTEYSVDGGQFMTGNTVVVTRNGTNLVQFFTKDASGNVEATQTLTIKIDRTTPFITEHANPNRLWPPNHKFDTVTVSGVAVDRISGLNPSRVFFFVRDEYGQVQPRGSAVVMPDGTYSFQVQLQSSRYGQDHDGRQYTIFVVARSGAGRIGWHSAVVTVPHDQGHSAGAGSGSDYEDDGQNFGQHGNHGASGNHGHGVAQGMNAGHGKKGHKHG